MTLLHALARGIASLVLVACGGGEPSPDAATGVTTSSSGGASSDPSVSTSSASSGAGPEAECDDPELAWRSGMKTSYESYPEPGSEECVEFSGCEYEGQFAACEHTMPESWVAAHDLAAVFPLGDLALHRLCVRSGDHTRVVTVVDTCADADCDGCCTANRGDADALVDLEKYTAERFGVEDGPIAWADLGPGDPDFDGCNG